MCTQWDGSHVVKFVLEVEHLFVRDARALPQRANMLPLRPISNNDEQNCLTYSASGIKPKGGQPLTRPRLTMRTRDDGHGHICARECLNRSSCRREEIERCSI